MTAHVDPFTKRVLPPRELWPELPMGDLRYPAKLNCATELLDRAVAGSFADRIALRFPGGTWTYRTLHAHANRIANLLVKDLELVPGNRVLLRGPNNPMMAACWFAVLKAGGVVVCTMPLLRARELAYLIEKAQITHALCDVRFANELEQAASSAPVLRHLATFRAESDEDRADFARGHPESFANVETAADDVALIAFTSGTTGAAKGTMHFHRDVLAICDLFPRHILRATADDIFCGSPPLAFTFGLGGILLFPMRIGASTLLLEQATPPHLLQAMQDFRTSVCFTAPTAYRAMASSCADFDLSALRKCVSAGEHLPAATFEKWHEATGIRIIDGIGSTEMLHIFISAAGDDIRAGSTGRAVPGYRARVIDADGREVPRDTIGHLAVQGPTGCRYLDDADRQRAYVRDGWNLPGDSYRMDADGYFWYQARTDDLIVSSGYKISGPEVENALLDHPSVAECGVVGVPDEERGCVVKAFVVLRAGTAASEDTVKALQEFVKTQIAPYKYPRRIEFVSSLPRTETGKLQRYRLREPSATAAPERR